MTRRSRMAKADLHRAYQEMFKAYPFHHFVHLSFDRLPPCDQEVARTARKFIRKVITKTSLSVAALGVIARHGKEGRPHIHLALYGKNSDGKYLIEVPSAEIASNWLHGNAEGSAIYDMEGVANYLAKNLAPGTSYEGEPIIYGAKILNAIRVG